MAEMKRTECYYVNGAAVFDAVHAALLAGHGRGLHGLIPPLLV